MSVAPICRLAKRLYSTHCTNSVLTNVWSVTVDCSLCALHKCPVIHQQLSYTLPYMKQLFSADGAGVSEETLNSTHYKVINKRIMGSCDHLLLVTPPLLPFPTCPTLQVLIAELELRQLSSRELVLRCCADLAEQQTKAVGSPEHKYGELEYSLAYIRPRSLVAITVVQTKNPGLEGRCATKGVFFLKGCGLAVIMCSLY